MINNRQSSRRRGRGGQRSQSNGGRGPESGNRIDNRARGNAAQLLEKYKALARDAQLQGDRVQAEYYLQFADHYFRVLSESRSRFEEQRRQRGDGDERGDDRNDDRDGDDSDDFDAIGADDAAPRHNGNGHQAGNDRGNGAERQGDTDRPARGARQPQRGERADRAERDAGQRRGSGGGGRRDQDEAAAEGIEIDRLPPAFGAAAEAEPEAPAEEAPRPRRGRPRRQPAAEATADS